METQLSLNLTLEQRSNKLLKPDERPFTLSLYLMIVINSKKPIIPNDSLNPAYPIAMA